MQITRVFKGAEVLRPSPSTTLGYFGERLSHFGLGPLSFPGPVPQDGHHGSPEGLSQPTGRPAEHLLPRPAFCHSLYQQLLANQNQRKAPVTATSAIISCPVDEPNIGSGDGS